MANIITVRLLVDETPNTPEDMLGGVINGLLYNEQESGQNASEGRSWLVDWQIGASVPACPSLAAAICNKTYAEGGAFREVAPQIDAPFEFAVEAHSSNEWVNGPDYAVLTIDQAFIDLLTRLRRACKDNGLESVNATYYPKAWDREEALRIQGDSLRVTRSGSFWFEGHPKHCDWGVETKCLEIDDLLKIVEDRLTGDLPEGYILSNGRLFFGSTYLVERFEENSEEESGDESPEPSIDASIVASRPVHSPFCWKLSDAPSVTPRLVPDCQPPFRTWAATELDLLKLAAAALRDFYAAYPCDTTFPDVSAGEYGTGAGGIEQLLKALDKAREGRTDRVLDRDPVVADAGTVPAPVQVRLRLSVDVVYDLNGERPAIAKAMLKNIAERAYEEGMLTGETELELAQFSAVVNEVPLLSEEEIVPFMAYRLENGEWDAEDIPVRLARYGLMDPADFAAEMRERIEMAKEESL